MFGQMFTSSLLQAQTVCYLYGVLFVCYVALKRVHILLRSEFELKLETHCALSQ